MRCSKTVIGVVVAGLAGAGPWLGCGSSPVTVASGQAGPRRLALDGANLYWLAGNDVMKLVP